MAAIKIAVTGWGGIVLNDRQLKNLMRSAGGSVRTQTARLINRAGGSGRSYTAKGGAKYRASSPGSPPVRVSGSLRTSLKNYAYKSGLGFAVRARQFYALFLEAGAKGGGNQFGGRPDAAAAHRARYPRRRRAKGKYTTRVLLPRPFLDLVMKREAPDITRRVQTAFREGLTWKETKAK
jgi:hypothetical protein